MNDKEIFIVGAGTYGEAMYELAELLGYTVKGFYDDDYEKINTKIMGAEIIGQISDLTDENIKDNQFIVAIGNNKLRCKIMTMINNLGGITPTLIHPSAIISPSSIIGNGVYIQANAYIWTKVQIDDYCIISPNVVVAHHSILGKACLVSTQSAIGASILVENKVFIGMGSTIVTGVSLIGKNAVIGAGAVVLENVDSYSVNVGVPALKIKDLSRKKVVI